MGRGRERGPQGRTSRLPRTTQPKYSERAYTINNPPHDSRDYLCSQGLKEAVDKLRARK
jgi:hypothetical protein